MRAAKDGEIFIYEDFHLIGDKDCPECFHEPTPCKCGGLIHHELIDSDMDSLTISHLCDRCVRDTYDR